MADIPPTISSSVQDTVPTSPLAIAPARPRVLFTSFEPSGDDHAAAVIKHLIDIRPNIDVFAWGGPHMEAAGATLVERTGKDAVMGIVGWKKIQEHREINARIAAWMSANVPVVHVPVDSPAANFPLCKVAKKRGIRVLHMVAPQVWAWATWRLGKLRRRTDMVLCILPFEEHWFRARNVPATFVGHPIFSEPLNEPRISQQLETFPDGTLKLLVLPGSRPKEMRKNFPVMLRVFRTLKKEHPQLVGLVAATNQESADALRAIANEHGGWPDGVSMKHSCTDAAVRWADIAFVVSGTVTLQVARQSRPMVVMYVSSPVVFYILGKLIVKIRLFALPNLIADRMVVYESVPHYGSDQRLTDALTELIEHEHRRQEQSAQLAAVVSAFKGHNAAKEAAEAIALMADEGAENETIGRELE